MAHPLQDKISIKAFLASLTHRPGVYQMLDEEGAVLYVGKARDLKKRISSYFSKSQKDPKTARLMQQVVDITITVTPDENAALLLECNLIKKLRPHYNVLLRDDKSYPYILLTRHAFPQITLYRGRKKKQDGQFFGPYADTGAVRDAIHLIEKLFRLRNCSNSFFASRKRPCIQYQIDRCTAPCTKLISEEDYQLNVQHAKLFLEGKEAEVIKNIQSDMEQAATDLDYEHAAGCRDLIARLREIQSSQYVSGREGDVDVIGFALTAHQVCLQMLMLRNGRMSGSRAFFPDVPEDAQAGEIVSSFIEQHYLDSESQPKDIPHLIVTGVSLPDASWLTNVLRTRAGHAVTLSPGQRGERHKWLEMADNSARQSIATRMFTKTDLLERFRSLAKWLDLPEPPTRIECTDISHTMGEATVGSCVVFNQDGPLKHFYRRFNITHITPGNDTAAMEQLLQRRFASIRAGDESHLPDILFIDGGIPQLHAAQHALESLGMNRILTIGVAKGSTRKAGFEVLHLPHQKPVHLPPDSQALHLIQQIRDEAHRFAITGHRQKRDRKRTQSVLETIPGVGAKRRRELLRYFGGLQAINRASLDEILKVPGISRALAGRIYDTLHR